MPIYEYACHDRHQGFELLVRADTALRCPHCGSQRLDKQLSVFTTASASTAVGPRDFAALPAACAPCGACGHPDGPGACARPS